MPSEPATYKTRTLQAIAFVILGYFGYSVADLCAKLLQQHYGIYQVLGISGAVGFTITGLWLLLRYGPKAFFPANLKLHLIRAVFVFGTAYFAVAALRTLPLADFYGIVFMTPFLVMILAVLVLNEKVGWRRWLAALVGFSGVIILAGPQFNNLSEGVIYAACGVICAGFNVITIRKIGSNAPIPLYGFYPFLLIGGINLTAMIMTDSFLPFEKEYLPAFVFHGPFVALGLLGISIGFSKAPETAVVAPFHYIQIIWGVLFGYIFFHTLPTQTTVMGLTLIIGAGLYSLWREYRRKHPSL